MKSSSFMASPRPNRADGKPKLSRENPDNYFLEENDLDAAAEGSPKIFFPSLVAAGGNFGGNRFSLFSSESESLPMVRSCDEMQ